MIDADTKLCCVIGNPVAQSISPLVHNAAYKTLGLNYVFLAFKVTDVKKAIAGLRTTGVCGISVTIPHKLAVLECVDEVDEVARKIGAANTIVNKNGKFMATNTDWIGAIKALEEKTTLTDKTVALIGAGGAARAIAYGLSEKRARVTVFARNLEMGKKLVADFRLSGAASLSDEAKINTCDIVINATPVGMAPFLDQSPISFDGINSQQIVFDAVFKPRETKLIQYAKAKKAKVIYGHKMLIYQALEQFKLFTERKAPQEIMEKVLRQVLL